MRSILCAVISKSSQAQLGSPLETASPSSASNSAMSPVAAPGTTTPGAGAPCAACKFLRRKCLPGCVFAPYFPPEEPQKFANVHKVFGASNVTKLLNELLPHQREDAVGSLAYEAEARVKDPVYGCVGAISMLQCQVHRLQKELDAAHAELLRYACGGVGIPTALPVSASPRLSTAMRSSGQLGAATAGGMYSGRRLGVIDGIAPPPPPPPAGCYFRRNNVVTSPGADVAPVLPYGSIAECHQSHLLPIREHWYGSQGRRQQHVNEVPPIMWTGPMALMRWEDTMNEASGRR